MTDVPTLQPLERELAHAFADARAGDYMSMSRLRAVVQAYATEQRALGVPPDVVVTTIREIGGMGGDGVDPGLAAQIAHWSKPTLYPLI